MKKYFVRTAIILIIGLFVTLALACSKTNRLERLKYNKEIMKQRLDKDRFFGEYSGSPLLPVQRMTFKGLKYFKPDISYRLQAVFTPHKSQKAFKIQTSSGQERLYIVKGHLDFTYGGKKLTLTAYQEKDQAASHPNTLFIPFTDQNSGRLTYGAGRYIEIKSVGQKKQQVILDFNLAYNPYCAYNHNYSCPIPPPANHLDVAVNAGEKKFH